jgi:diguanylate cyclase (GGDEF)-like protein
VRDERGPSGADVRLVRTERTAAHGQPRREFSPATEHQLIVLCLRFAWCVFPVSFLCCVMSIALAGQPIADRRSLMYLATNLVSGVAVLTTAVVARSKPTQTSLNLFTLAAALNVGAYSAHPNIFGALNTLEGAAVQVNSVLIAMILQAAMMCGIRRVSNTIVLTYMGIAYVGPIHPELPLWMRTTTVVVVVVALLVGVTALHQVLRKSLDLAQRNDELITQLSAANEALARAAERDGLTGVLNRRGWLNATARLDGVSHVASRSVERRGVLHRQSLQPVTAPADDAGNQRFGIVYVDIDRFKTINDQFGHAIGDEVLCKVADAIVDTLRPGDVVARLGGDEFAALFAITGPDELQAVEQRLRVSLERSAADSSCAWTASFGSALVDTTIGIRQAAVDADFHLYQRKADRSPDRQVPHLSN